ncbi:MAG: hypothetical protein JNL97_12990 [Verrucomicrobiales bacterium]|nr:hypothetical protein [Verrucomicrobiales bacterium]
MNRNNCFDARLEVEVPHSQRRQVGRVPLANVETVTQARDVPNDLPNQRVKDTLSGARETPTFTAYADGYLPHFEGMPGAETERTAKCSFIVRFHPVRSVWIDRFLGHPISEFTVEPTQSTNAGLYWVEVRNSAGRVGSDGARLYVSRSSVWEVAKGGNDHRYEFLHSGGRELDWSDVLRDVRNRGGYLATFHSRAEEDFVRWTFPVTTTSLAGMIQDPGSTEPGGGWRWMSGEPMTYKHWAAGEPNNGLRANRSIINPRGFENLMVFYGDGTWNDLHGGGTGYFVEYPAKIVLWEQPTHAVVRGYETVCMRAAGACSRPLTYQWFVNGVLRPGVTGPELPTSEVPDDDSSCFYIASDGVNAVASTPASVRLGPLFGSTPESRVLRRGETSRLLAKVDGPGPFSYRWFKDGGRIPGAIEPELWVGPAADGTQGSYSVEVTNRNGVARSLEAAVVVEPANGTLVFSGSMPNANEAAWSLDNVAVFAIKKSEVQLELSRTRDPTQLLLQISSPAGAVITVAESHDLLEWRTMLVFTNASGAKAMLWTVGFKIRQRSGRDDATVGGVQDAGR